MYHRANTRCTDCEASHLLSSLATKYTIHCKDNREYANTTKHRTVLLQSCFLQVQRDYCVHICISVASSAARVVFAHHQTTVTSLMLVTNVYYYTGETTTLKGNNCSSILYYITVKAIITTWIILLYHDDSYTSNGDNNYLLSTVSVQLVTNMLAAQPTKADAIPCAQLFLTSATTASMHCRLASIVRSCCPS